MAKTLFYRHIYNEVFSELDKRDIVETEKVVIVDNRKQNLYKARIVARSTDNR